MFLWCTAILCFLLAVKFLRRTLASFSVIDFGLTQQRQSLRKVENTLREIEETFIAGLIPSQSQWATIRQLQPPWGNLVAESLEGLRACGASLLPTLKRLRRLAEEQNESLGIARAKSSQALAQALSCTLLVPALGMSLYCLLPAVQQRIQVWLFTVGFALTLSGIGGYWLVHMSNSARWGGIQNQNRSWILGALCAGERFLALVRSGTPADLAWTKVCELLSRETGSLASAWKYSIWEESDARGTSGVSERSIILAGNSIKKAVQVSLIEGRPCLERVETALGALGAELRSQVDRELSLLSTRALKPLFLCVAPGIFCLLILALWLVWTETSGGDFSGF